MTPGSLRPTESGREPGTDAPIGCQISIGAGRISGRGGPREIDFRLRTFLYIVWPAAPGYEVPLPFRREKRTVCLWGSKPTLR
jgi:hypothetical protein